RFSEFPNPRTPTQGQRTLCPVTDLALIVIHRRSRRHGVFRTTVDVRKHQPRGTSINTTSEFSTTRSKRILLPSGDTSKRFSDSPGRRLVKRRRLPVARSTSQKSCRRNPPSLTTSCRVRGRKR